MAVVNYQRLPVDQTSVTYELGPDSYPQQGVTPGVTTELLIAHPSAYPATTRKVWVHAPRNLDSAAPLPVMVFNDGWWYLDPAGDIRGAIVLDNLIAARDIPPMLGVFVDPGRVDGTERPGQQRNAEYDAFDARYATFLCDDVLAAVAAQFRVTDEPTLRAICGGSSGGNAAFTAAWQRPDAFGKVVGFLSSFAQMPGGNPYTAALAAEPVRPTRIFLASGHRDLGWNEPTDNWLADSLETSAALARAGYDFRLVLGDGSHSPNHAGAILPDALRWLWRDWAG